MPCAQMTDAPGSAFAVVSFPAKRVAALMEVLSDVPTPVVQIVDSYAGRSPPSELIRDLSRHIPAGGRLWTYERPADSDYDGKRRHGTSPPHVDAAVFTTGVQLRGLCTPRGPDGSSSFSRSSVSTFLKMVTDRGCGELPIARAVRALADRDDALYVVQLSYDFYVDFRFALLAVPEPFSGAAVDGPTAWPLVKGVTGWSAPSALLFAAAEPLHGLLVTRLSS
jgi:hypothetical protein